MIYAFLKEKGGEKKSEGRWKELLHLVVAFVGCNFLAAVELWVSSGGAHF